MAVNPLIPYNIIFISSVYCKERIEIFSDFFVKKMHWQKKNLHLFLIVLILKSCIGQHTADQQADVNTKKVLKYIADLPKQGIKK